MNTFHEIQAIIPIYLDNCFSTQCFMRLNKQTQTKTSKQKNKKGGTQQLVRLKGIKHFTLQVSHTQFDIYSYVQVLYKVWAIGNKTDSERVCNFLKNRSISVRVATPSFLNNTRNCVTAHLKAYVIYNTCMAYFSKYIDSFSTNQFFKIIIGFLFLKSHTHGRLCFYTHTHRKPSRRDSGYICNYKIKKF